jgi:hypothetical protein
MSQKVREGKRKAQTIADDSKITELQTKLVVAREKIDRYFKETLEKDRDIAQLKYDLQDAVTGDARRREDKPEDREIRTLGQRIRVVIELLSGKIDYSKLERVDIGKLNQEKHQIYHHFENCDGWTRIEDHELLKQRLGDAEATSQILRERAEANATRNWETEKRLDAALRLVQQLQTDKWGPELASARLSLECERRKVKALEDRIAGLE